MATGNLSKTFVGVLETAKMHRVVELARMVDLDRRERGIFLGESSQTGQKFADAAMVRFFQNDTTQRLDRRWLLPARLGATLRDIFEQLSAVPGRGEAYGDAAHEVDRNLADFVGVAAVNPNAFTE